MAAESFEFKSEARQLLDLMIHSLYSTRDIFLRELISNASDALDKLRFESLTDSALLPEGQTLEIRVLADEEDQTLTIEDNGIGMSRDELINNLGTIAKSGTKAFLAEAKEQEGADQLDQLIGQFGVGFYSSFIVADSVEVVSRRAGSDEAWRWRSAGDGQFEIEAAERERSGTTITLSLRARAEDDEESEDFTKNWTLKQTIKRYSDFVQYPVRLYTEREIPVKDEEGEPIEGEFETESEWEQINSMKAIWTKSPDDVSDEEYAEFYKHISNDWKEPFDRTRITAESPFAYTALTFIPSEQPFGLFYRDQKYGLQLFVNRVLIMERCEELLPEWLRFVRGVVESPDLSLNVSREILQQDRKVKNIRKRIVRKTLDSLAKLLADDRERYESFWGNFGRVLKEGSMDGDFKERLKKLYLFKSSTQEGLTTLGEYVERMGEEQEEIYYLLADSPELAATSPHMESFREKGVEVLFLTEEIIDEWMAGNLDEFEEKKLRSIGEGEVELGSEEERKAAEEERKEKSEALGGLLEALKGGLDEEIEEVRLSSRLASSPAVLVNKEGAMSPAIRRMMEQSGQKLPPEKRILELNPGHAIIEKLQGIHESNAEDPQIGQYAKLLHGQALLAEGGTLADPSSFNEALTAVLAR